MNHSCPLCGSPSNSYEEFRRFLSEELEHRGINLVTLHPGRDASNRFFWEATVGSHARACYWTVRATVPNGIDHCSRRVVNSVAAQIESALAQKEQALVAALAQKEPPP